MRGFENETTCGLLAKPFKYKWTAIEELLIACRVALNRPVKLTRNLRSPISSSLTNTNVAKQAIPSKANILSRRNHFPRSSCGALLVPQKNISNNDPRSSHRCEFSRKICNRTVCRSRNGQGRNSVNFAGDYSKSDRFVFAYFPTRFFIKFIHTKTKPVNASTIITGKEW